MDKVVLAGNPPVTVRLKRSDRARRLLLRVSRIDGRVSLSLPSWTPDSEASRFAQEKESWIRRQLDSSVLRISPEIGGNIMFEGANVPILSIQGRSVRFSEGKLLVPGDPGRAPKRIVAFLKVVARQRFVAASDSYAAKLGTGFGSVTIRDTRSRWGSCSSEGNLMFSWRLIMAPVEVLDYVVAHEVAHLVEMNHSAAFWEVVEGLCPEYQVPRNWLRKYGHQLHAYRFGN